VVGTPLEVAVGEIVPQSAPEHETAHVTPLFARSLVTLAVNCTVVPAATVVGTGVIKTTGITPGTVMPAEADADAEATEVAVSVTAKSVAGPLAGAV